MRRLANSCLMPFVLLLAIVAGMPALANDPANLIIDDASVFAPCDSPCPPSAAPMPDGQKRINPGNIEQVLTDDFLSRWGIFVPKPAYVFTKNAQFGNGRNAWTGVAYVDGNRYRAYVQPDGSVFTWRLSDLDHLPVGNQRVLTVVVDHGNSDIATWLGTPLDDLQAIINQDHWDHAAGLGLPAPIVSFTFTNLLVSATEFADPIQGPKTPADVEALVTAKGYVVDDYEIIAVMDIDPANASGGFAFFGGSFAYIGYFSLPDPGFVNLTAEHMASTTRALYHHEIGHSWGWEHNWDNGGLTYRGPLIVNPRLFGWTDTDGDGVPEIQDPTPYGAP